MSILGRLLSAPVRLINAPLRMLEDFDGTKTPEEDRMISKPLDTIAKGIERGVDYIKNGD